MCACGCVCIYVQDAPIKNDPVEKILYFSNGSTDLSQILLKQLFWFERYGSLNFIVHFLK